MKQIIITLLLFCFACSIKAQDKDIQAKKELQQLSWDWMNAWKSKDSVYLNKILAPEFRLLALINGDLVTMDKLNWLKVAKSYIPTDFRYYDFDIRIYENTAIVQSKFDLNATLNGQDRSGTFQITDIWVKNKNVWQVVHRHTNLKPRPMTD